MLANKVVQDGFVGAGSRALNPAGARWQEKRQSRQCRQILLSCRRKLSEQLGAEVNIQAKKTNGGRRAEIELCQI